MALEKRGARFYFYRKRREGSKVISEYVCAGPKAVSEWLADRERQQAERAVCQTATEIRRMMRGSAGHIAFHRKRVRELVSRELNLLDYYCHRGCWRRRMKTTKTTKTCAEKAPSTDEFALVNHMARSVQHTIVTERIDDEVAQRTVFAELQQMRTLLGREHPSAVESILIESVLNSYLAVRAAEDYAAKVDKDPEYETDTHFEWAQGEVQRTRRLHQEAVEGLARVSKLLARPARKTADKTAPSPQPIGGQNHNGDAQDP